MLVGHIDYRIGNQKCTQHKLYAVIVHEISPLFWRILTFFFFKKSGIFYDKNGGLTVTARKSRIMKGTADKIRETVFKKGHIHATVFLLDD